MNDPVSEMFEELKPEDRQALKDRFFNEFMHPLSIDNRVRFLQDQMPQIWSRIVMLEYLQRLQQERGGSFSKSVAFVHTSSQQGGSVFCVKRIGQVDYFGLTFPLENFEHEDLAPGVIILPLDAILWVGVTDQPFDKGEMGFGSKLGGTSGKANDARKLAGLIEPEEPATPQEAEKNGEEEKAPRA